MKTIEPIFMLSCGDLFPVLTKYSVVRLYKGKLRVIEKILVQFDRRIIDRKLSDLTIYDLDKIRNSNLNNEMDRVKFVRGLDDDYYPNYDLVGQAVRDTIDNIEAEQKLLFVDWGSTKNLLKWPDNDKIMNYLFSSPEDLIEVVEKDILE